MNIHEFQKLMRRIYYHRDSQRGTTRTFEWLVEEVQELGEALKERNAKALEGEFADVLAWLASLANVVNIDLERAGTIKYDGKCPKCRQVPCNCSV